MKKFGAILLISGTCIGSGMIALPLVLAKLGLVASLSLMLLIWFIVYYTSLVNLELNLQAGKGLPLGELARLYSGRGAEWIGVISLKTLSYSLLAVYLYGGSSIIQELFSAKTGIDYSFHLIASWFALITAILLLLPIRLIDYCNRVLFLSLLGVVLLLIFGLAISIDWQNLPLISLEMCRLPSWAAVIPVVFTSFGFQVIFHTLTNYCHKDARMLKQAFFWGSMIPALVYLVWTSSILSVVYHQDPEFYKLMIHGEAEVGELIKVLSGIARSQAVQVLIWMISLLAIFTSVIGVGVSLFESIRRMMRYWVPGSVSQQILSSLATVGPAYLAVLLIPNAFIAILGFAGMILAVIAIILPLYLFLKMKASILYYPELKRKTLLLFSLLIATIVIFAEIYNLY